MTAFDDCFKIVVGEEGGYVNDPKDPGGETKYGVSKRSYPTLDIKNLTLAKAKEIYKSNYWNNAKCEAMPAPIALLVFDAAINCGVGQSIKLLQRALVAHGYKLLVDGKPSILTVASTKTAPIEALCIDFLSYQIIFKSHLGKDANNNNIPDLWERFDLGWSRRCFRMMQHATKMIVGKH